MFDRIVSDCKEPPMVVFDGDSLQPPTNKLPYYCQACVEEFQSNQSRWFDDKETHDVIYNALVATDGTDWNTPDDDEVYYLLSKKWSVAGGLRKGIDLWHASASDVNRCVSFGVVVCVSLSLSVSGRPPSGSSMRRLVRPWQPPRHRVRGRSSLRGE